jgi:uncharacterized protein (UPF0332 family)
MPEKLIDDLLRQGKLKELKVAFIQIEELLQESIIDLQEASKIQTIAQRATYLMAYNAMLKAGRAILLLKGYTPSDGAQHKTVVIMTSHLLGPKFKNIVAHFEKMRVKRNMMTYEAHTLISIVESKNAFKEAIELVQGIIKAVKIKNPQLELDFNVDKL